MTDTMQANAPDRSDLPAAEEVEPAIRIRNLTKSFGSKTVLEDITFDIPKNFVNVILGPSGTGKSVFLRHLIGLLRPTEGEVWVGDANVPTLRQRKLLEVRKKFGVLFQDGALFGSMTLYDNTAFPLREHTKKGEKEIKDIVMEKLGMVGLADAADQFPSEVSGGMKKRAGLARALVLDPEIVLFDEPDSGLDPVRNAYLADLILDLKEQLDSTFIIVTHNIALAEYISDYIGLLFRRGLVTFGTNHEMFNSEIPVVNQFLHGRTEGPIGMSEEQDAPDGASQSGGQQASQDGDQPSSQDGARPERAEAGERRAPDEASGSADETEVIDVEDVDASGDGRKRKSSGKFNW